MPSNLTTIPAPRAPLVDPDTGLIATEWYRFLFNIYTLAGSGSNLVSLDDLQLGPPTQPAITTGGGGSGTVTSVGISTSAASLAITNSPITSSGSIGVNFAGAAGQYVRGDGALANFPTSTGGGSSFAYYLNGGTNQGTFVGNTYYEMSRIPVIGTNADFSISTNGYIAQFITDAGDPALLSIPAGNWNFQMYFSVSSNTGNPSYHVELSKYDGSTFTAIATSVGTPEPITNGTTIDIYNTSLAVPQTTLTLTDRLAVRVYVIHGGGGRTVTLHTQDTHLCEIITTFSTGLTALNGLTAQIQYLAVGTTGTDFNIASATDTHTFNIPSSSATNRGLLTAADWTTFNNKTSNLGTVTSVAATAGTGISVTGSPITTSGTLTITNTAPDQTVAITAGTGISVTGTYPNFSVTNTAPSSGGTVTSVSGTGSVNGITLTGTVTSSGSLTLGGTLGSIANSQLTNSSVTFNGVAVALGASGVITATATNALTIGTGLSGTSYNGSAPVTIANTGVLGVTGTAPVASSGGQNPVISMAAATGSVNGYLTSTDWNTFNNKQPAGTYVNSVSGTAGRITSTGGVTPVIDLASGIATPGTTGSSTLIPVITVDTYGRVTAVTTAANPQGTVTSVGGTGTVNGITLTGTVTSSGNLTLGGTLSGVSLATQVTGTLPIANGGTGQTTASAAFNALSPITSTGDLILGNGVNSATRLGIGLNTYVLTSNGTTASWQAPAAGGSNITPLGMWENNRTISANYTIGSTNSAMSSGPITINSGVVVTVPAGSRWVVL